MSIMKDIYIEEYERIMEETPDINENRAGELAYDRMRDRFADMCDEAKDRAKYAE